MKKSIVSDIEWAEKLQTLLESTGEAGISVRYRAPGVTLVANGCQLQVDGRKMLTLPPPAKPLAQIDGALEVELPEWDDASAGYYCFEDETGQMYLSVRHQTANIPQNYAELELATTPELLDASVSAPLVH